MRLWLAAAGLLPFLLLSGCSQPALTLETAPGVVDEALAELASTAHGNETTIRMATMDQVGWKGEHREGGMRIEFEWGDGGTERVKAFDPQPGPDSMDALEAYCLADYEYLLAPNGTFEARRGLGWCSILDGAKSPSGNGLHDWMLFRREGDVTIDSEGHAHARAAAIRSEAYDESGDSVLNVTVDKDGRILALEGRMDDGRETVSWAIDYGNRRSFERPTGVKDRMAVPESLVRSGRLADEQTVESRSRPSYGGGAGAEAGPSVPSVPRSELSLRAYDGTRLVAEFPMESDGAQGGYAFTYADADADGAYSQGDAMTVRGPGAGDLRLVLYDEWAGHEAGYNPYEIPAAPWLAAAGLALALLLRRR